MTHPDPNASNSSTNVASGYLGAGDLEKGRGPAHIERMITPGGHPIDFSQPAIPVQHRKFGNPIPIGLIAFSMAFMMVGLLSVGVRGIKAPNGVLSSLSESALPLLGSAADISVLRRHHPDPRRLVRDVHRQHLLVS